MEWQGVLCLKCRAASDFDTHRDNMGLWIFEDYPCTTFIYLMCHACKAGSQIYLGDSWLEDTAYLEGIGIGASRIDAAPKHVVQGYQDTFGFLPITAHQEREIAFAHYLIGQCAAEISLNEWEMRYGQAS